MWFSLPSILYCGFFLISRPSSVHFSSYASLSLSLVISWWSPPLWNWCLPLTSGNHGVLGKGFFQSTLETLHLLWELKGKSASPHEAIHTLLLGSWQVKVIASGWMRCNSLDTIPPNGIKVAQCAPLLHQRDIPALVKLGAWKHSPLRPTHLKSCFFPGKWNVQCFSPRSTSTGRRCRRLSQKKWLWFVLVRKMKGWMQNFETCK